MLLNMLKNRLRLKRYVKIISTVILLSFLRFPVFGEPPMELQPTLNEGGTRYYSDSEIDYLAELDTLIEDLTEAAKEAIEKAAAEAARAATLASVDRESTAFREASLQRTEALRQQAEVLRWQTEAETRKRIGVRNTIITGLVCFIGGFLVGIVLQH